MPVKNLPCDVSYYAEDLQNGGGITGDNGNHDLRLLVDGVPLTPSGSITEPDSTTLQGWYNLHIHDDENTGDIMVLGGKSSTGSVALRGVQWFNEPSVRFDVSTDIANSNIVQVSGEYVSLADFQVGGGGSVNVAEIADAVWDEAVADHSSEGTFGRAIISTSGILLDSINIGSGIATTRQLNNWGLILLNHLRDSGIEP
jgi:hypothetical protein